MRDALKGCNRSTEAHEASAKRVHLLMPRTSSGTLGSAVWAGANPPPHGRGWGRRHGRQLGRRHGGVGGIHCCVMSSLAWYDTCNVLVCFSFVPLSLAHTRRVPGKFYFICIDR